MTQSKNADNTEKTDASTEDTVKSRSLTDIVDSERRVQSNNIVKNYVMVSMTAGMVPIPVFDLVALVATQVKMVHGLAKHYDVPFKKELARSLITSLLSGALGTGAVMGLASIAKMLPGIGTIMGSVSVPLVGGALTYAVGRVFTQHFEQGGTLLNFDPKKMRGLFKREVEAGKEAVQNLKDGDKTQQAAPAAT